MLSSELFSAGLAGSDPDYSHTDSSQASGQHSSLEPGAAAGIMASATGSQRPATGLRYQIESRGPWSPGRAELEDFVADAFRRLHGAQIHSFMPTLLALRNVGGHDDGRVCAVAGYRLASQQALFLEQYLEEPVEAALADRLGEAVPRGQVVEIGNFAGANCRAARHLAAQMPAWLLEQGQSWAVFTATSLIRDILAGLGIRMLELKGADRRRLAGNGADWGAYYAADPRVMAACIPDALGLSLARRRPRN